MRRTYSVGRFGLAAIVAVALVLGAMSSIQAADKIVDKIHFLIPGGAGGGWDGTARGTGEALTKSGIVGSASYENMSGGGGGKAIGFLIENAASNHGTLMVNSTPIVIRSLVGRFPHNFRDLTMIAGTIGDYAAIITGKNSPYKNFADVVAAYKKNPRKVSVGGGSVPGGMDHLVAALAFQAAGADPTKVKYIPYDAGGKLNAAILSGEVAAGSTGFSEAVGTGKGRGDADSRGNLHRACPGVQGCADPQGAGIRHNVRQLARLFCRSRTAGRTRRTCTARPSPRCMPRPSGRPCATATAGLTFTTPARTSPRSWRIRKR